MKKKSLFAGFLALVMSVSMMSVTAFATENDIVKPDVQGKEIIVNSVEELKWVSAYSNGDIATVDNIPVTFAGYTIKITKDIENIGEWKPLVNFNGNMTGVLKDDESTPVLSEINVSVPENAGLCGNSANGKISNLTIANSSFVTTQSGNDIGNNAGAFAGNGFTSSFENCHVIDTIVTGNRFVGGITGYCYGNIIDCTVKGSGTVVSASFNGGLITNRYCGDNAGGIVGFMGEGNMKVTGCTVEGIKVQGSRQVAGIAGIALYGNTVSGNTVKDVTLVASWATNISVRNTTAAVGGILGQIQPGSTVITIDGNKVEGLTVERTHGNNNYCGWLLGDDTRGTNYTATNNTYVGTPSLPEIYGK